MTECSGLHTIADDGQILAFQGCAYEPADHKISGLFRAVGVEEPENSIIQAIGLVIRL